jgi:signal transduction histidine kinase
MDEIRAILRRQRPEKKKMALLQLYELCADCNKKGVEAELNTEGNLSAISDMLWEIILDNTFEAVTNSMKYSRCRSIDISILVMNEMVRCSVSDDGVGCETVKDGMGISGMRQRIRNAGGSINFETEAGFSVNMLLPLKGA